jgi:hypothetical protein
MTTKPPKPVTAAKVRAVLRQAGHRKGEFVKSSQIRGAGYWKSGYVVREKCYPDNHIVIEHQNGRGMERDSNLRQSSLKNYVATIARAGIPCDIVGEEVVVRIEPAKGGS